MRDAVWMVITVCCTAGAINALACGNVAMRGKATQSSTGGYATADKAIDGSRDGDYHHGSCTHTRSEPQPWWSVDLFAQESVLSVKITNRADCCSKRFKDVTVHVGNALKHLGGQNPVCGTISSLKAGETAVLDCHGMLGRFVDVVTGHHILTLCEVEVYARDCGARGEWRAVQHPE
ncbi:fucolectin-like [Leucoraja erinacea]|uniref:fucolectin-like n=1 Tax=Leucoraja erinaceus TaxID=7782 RepID=UPI002458344A|nr:fucolectin-like [Leucoraja erinacea]XP_055521507.1 fucolectin-like [Leucoraja erinacea]